MSALKKQRTGIYRRSKHEINNLLNHELRPTYKDLLTDIDNVHNTIHTGDTVQGTLDLGVCTYRLESFLYVETNYSTIDTFVPLTPIQQVHSKLLCLSDDILIQVVQYLEPAELIKVRGVCTQLRTLIYNPDVWTVNVLTRIADDSVYTDVIIDRTYNEFMWYWRCSRNNIVLKYRDITDAHIMTAGMNDLHYAFLTKHMLTIKRIVVQLNRVNLPGISDLPRLCPRVNYLSSTKMYPSLIEPLTEFPLKTLKVELDKLNGLAEISLLRGIGGINLHELDVQMFQTLLHVEQIFVHIRLHKDAPFSDVQQYVELLESVPNVYITGVSRVLGGNAPGDNNHNTDYGGLYIMRGAQTIPKQNDVTTNE